MASKMMAFSAKCLKTAAPGGPAAFLARHNMIQAAKVILRTISWFYHCASQRQAFLQAHLAFQHRLPVCMPLLCRRATASRHRAPRHGGSAVDGRRAADPGGAVHMMDDIAASVRGRKLFLSSEHERLESR